MLFTFFMFFRIFVPTHDSLKGVQAPWFLKGVTLQGPGGAEALLRRAEEAPGGPEGAAECPEAVWLKF